MLLAGEFKGQLIPKSKLSGNGVYSDQTISSYEKYMDENPEILFSQFVDGKLLYIHSFLFRDIGDYFIKKLKYKIESGLRKNIDFSYLNYIDSKNLKLIYSSNNEINKFKPFFNGKLFNKLQDQMKNEND